MLLVSHLEAKNHKEALEFLYELIDNTRQNTVSEHLIKQLHQLVVRDSQRDIAGRYRDGDVYISGSNHKPPTALEVPIKMKELIEWLQRERKNYHVIELAALLHHKLANIHPFWDGNGRTARLVMNIVIMQDGYPLAIILKNDRKRYYRVLDLADNGDYKGICAFIAQAVMRSLTMYLKVLKPTEKIKERLIALEELSKKSPYSATYLRKLATLGKLEALKEGRNWLSSEKSLQNYLRSMREGRK